MAKSILAGKKGIIIPLALGLLALLLTYQYIQQREAALGLLAEPVKVLVVKKDVPRLTLLDETMVEVVSVPRAYRQPAALTEIKEAVNQVTMAPILKGEQVVGTKLAAYGLETGLAIKVPKGFRAVTVAVNQVTGVAGLIRPGNYVDVLSTLEFGNLQKSDQRTYTVFQNVLVLAVDQNLGPESEAAQAMTMAERKKAEERGDIAPSGQAIGPGRRQAAATVTLALPPPQVQGLVLAQASGSLTLALRSSFEGREAQQLGPANLMNILGVQEKIMFQPRTWREIRGTETQR